MQAQKAAHVNLSLQPEETDFFCCICLSAINWHRTRLSYLFAKWAPSQFESFCTVFTSPSMNDEPTEPDYMNQRPASKKRSKIRSTRDLQLGNLECSQPCLSAQQGGTELPRMTPGQWINMSIEAAFDGISIWWRMIAFYSREAGLESSVLEKRFSSWFQLEKPNQKHKLNKTAPRKPQNWK